MPTKSHHHLKRYKRKKPNRQLEQLVLFVAIVEPLMTLPQIFQIYGSHSTGISVLSWVLYLSASVVWLLYGIRTRNKPIIITDTLWIIVEVAVIVGVMNQ